MTAILLRLFERIYVKKVGTLPGLKQSADALFVRPTQRGGEEDEASDMHRGMENGESGCVACDPSVQQRLQEKQRETGPAALHG